jgi:hypothetical protein
MAWCAVPLPRYIAVTSSISRMSADKGGQGVNANRLVMDM